MADLDQNNATEAVRIVGSASSGNEQTPVQSTSNGALHLNLRDNSGTELGTTSNPLQTRNSFNDDQTINASGFLNASPPHSVFEHFYKSGLGPNIWDTATNGTGNVVFNSNKRVAELTIGTTSGDYVYRQTRKRFRYYPGRAVQASMTFNSGGNVSNIRKRFGYFDVNDGLYLEFTGTDIRFVGRTSASGSPAESFAISRSNWYDPLDGTGPSGQTIDFTKTVYMIIEFLWQGAGSVRLSFLQGRNHLKAAEKTFFGSTDGLDASYISNPNLPFRIEMQNTGTSTGSQINHICTSLIVFNDDELEGIPVAINSSITAKSVTNTPLISLRVRASTPTRGIYLTASDCFISGNNTAYVNIYLNPTLTGASWVTTGSCSEYDISATSFTGGTLVSSKIIRGNIPISLQDVIPSINNILGESINGTKDIISVTVQSFSGTVDTYSTLEWKEL